jgi:hypothetical protein
MLRTKLNTSTLATVKARADYFFEEQCKRLGPLTPLHTFTPAIVPLAPPKARRARRKSNPTE